MLRLTRGVRGQDVVRGAALHLRDGAGRAHEGVILALMPDSFLGIMLGSLIVHGR